MTETMTITLTREQLEAACEACEELTAEMHSEAVKHAVDPEDAAVKLACARKYGVAFEALRDLLAPSPIADGDKAVRCSGCGGTTVQTLDWINPNTDAVIGGNESLGSGDMWCDDCEDHHSLRYDSTKEEARA